MKAARKDKNYCDCLIIGAGPAGLVASVYLSRYRRHVRVIDSGESRAANIPLSRNVPGFPDGISGAELLQRLRLQAQAAGVVIEKGKVAKLEKMPGYFSARIGRKHIKASCVLLATGTVDDVIPRDLPREATWNGLVRWCPICDGNESLDRRIVLIGEPRHGPERALFLRTYTRELTLVIPPERGNLRRVDHQQLLKAGIELIRKSPKHAGFSQNDSGGILHFSDDSSLPFEVLYPMTGGHGRSTLATELGARCDRHGAVKIGAGQLTSIPGLYAAGDVVCSLKQISIAVAEGTLAATAIHHALPANFR